MKPASTGAAAGNANRFRLHSVACALCLCSLCTYLWVSSYTYILYMFVWLHSVYVCVWKFIKLLIVQTSCTHAYDVFLALPCLYFQFHQIALENWPHHILLHFLLHPLFILLLSWNCFASGQHVCSPRAQDGMRSAYGGQETILRTWTKSCPRCAANRSLEL